MELATLLIRDSLEASTLLRMESMEVLISVSTLLLKNLLRTFMVNAVLIAVINLGLIYFANLVIFPMHVSSVLVLEQNPYGTFPRLSYIW